MLHSIRQFISEYDLFSLPILSFIYIAILPFFIGDILFAEHAYTHGQYINYLHIRVTTQALLALIIYVKNRQRPLIAPLVQIGLLLLVIGNALVSGYTHGAMYSFTTFFYLTGFGLTLYTLIIAIKEVLLANRLQHTIFVALVTFSTGIQGALALFQFIAKEPFFPSLFSGFGQPTIFTSFSQVGINAVARGYGTTPHPNILAAILVLFVALVLTTSIAKIYKIGFIIIVGLILVTTLSKSGMLALFGVVICWMAHRYLRNVLDNRQFAIVIVLSALILIAGVFLIPVLAQFFPSESYLTTRAQLDAMYRELLQSNVSTILWGTGFRMSTLTLLEQMQTLNVSSIFNNRLLLEPPHHSLLLSLVEFGLLGTAAIGYFMTRCLTILINTLKSHPENFWFFYSILWILLVFGSLDHLLFY